jgi:hypothetical protein
VLPRHSWVRPLQTPVEYFETDPTTVSRGECGTEDVGNRKVALVRKHSTVSAPCLRSHYRGRRNVSSFRAYRTYTEARQEEINACCVGEADRQARRRSIEEGRCRKTSLSVRAPRGSDGVAPALLGGRRQECTGRPTLQQQCGTCRGT